MTARRILLLGLCLLLVLVLYLDRHEIYHRGGPNPAVTKEQFANLLLDQNVVASAPIFDDTTFPTIDFVNRDLIVTALGPYQLTTRFFDATYNEVQKPSGPGRYGAWVEIHFPNGLALTRHLTLFKTPFPYNPAGDAYNPEMQYPNAFGLPKELVERRHWDIKENFNDMIGNAAQTDDTFPVMAATLTDYKSDPIHWQGISYWCIESAWWTGLEKKLGVSVEYPHLVHLPDDYDKNPSQSWPLILFLHGSGECGDNLDMVKNDGPLGYINSGHPLPFIVVTPQCPRREWWDPEKLGLLVDQIAAKYRVDPKRIYVTGLSMGGFGSVDLAAAYPLRFAAIAPLSGGADPEIAPRIKMVPAWIFHGAVDTVVPTWYSTDLADRLKQTGADVTLTIYPGVGHEKWDVTYSNPKLYDWFLQHSLP